MNARNLVLLITGREDLVCDDEHVKAIDTAIREAEERGMRKAAAMLWDDLPEMERRRLKKGEKREAVLRLDMRDEIDRAAAKEKD
jgi:hypothetical protein